MDLIDRTSPVDSGHSIPSRRYAEIIDRIEEVRLTLRLNKSQFCQSFGMKPQTYSNYLGQQRSKPNLELLVGIVTRYGVDPFWVLTGAGPMFRNGIRADLESPLAARAPGLEPVRPTSGEESPDGTVPELALITPVLQRIEANFDRLDRMHVPILRRLLDVLHRYAQANPAGSAGELREFLERIEWKMLAR